MQAAVVRQVGGPFCLEQVNISNPRDDEVLVRMKAVGICHSDVSCRDQIFPAILPQVFGHEGAGIVEQVGRDVAGLLVGDHVVLTFNSCGRCDNCCSDMPAYCDDFDQLNASGARPDGSSALSIPNDKSNEVIAGHFFGQSSFAEYSIVNQRNAIKIDKDIDLTVAAPFGCAVQTGAGCVINALKPKAGQSLVIIGAGGVGLSAIMATKLIGDLTVIAIDLHDHRLALANTLGASHVINASKEDVQDAINRIFPNGVDYSIECSGAAAVQEAAISILSSRGVCALLGVPKMGARYDVPCYEINIGRTVKGVVSGDSNPHDFLPKLFDYYRHGLLPIEQLISRYPFSKINQAADDLVSGKTIKPVLVFD